MTNYLAGRTVGFVVAQHGIDEAELTGPRRVVAEAGATTVLVAPRLSRVRTIAGGGLCAEHHVDVTLADFTSDGVAALVLPDGEDNSRALRADADVSRLLQRFHASGRPIGAFGFAVWSLLDAGLVSGRQVTSHPSLRRDVERGGGSWLDHRVVVDANLITSRATQDVEAFSVQLVAHLDR